MLGLSSCSSLEKRIGKAKVLAYEHPNDFAGFCSDKFPVNTAYSEGKEIIKTDTVTQTNTITVTKVIKGDTVKINVECPKERVIRNTIYKTDTLRIENTSKLAYLSNRINLQDKELYQTKIEFKEADKKAKNRLWIIVILGVAVVGLIVLLFRR